MYVGAKLIEEVEDRFGKPQVLYLEHEIGDKELAFVRSSQKHGRAHDLTFFIFNNDHLALIRKPMFRRPIYRAPSGGLNPGESFEEGAKREALEETGLNVEIVDVLDVVDKIVEDETSRIKFHFVIIDYLAEYRGGMPVASSDALDVAWARSEEFTSYDLTPTLIDLFKRMGIYLES